MRTSLFVVACSLTAVFACGGSRNVQKSDIKTETELSVKKDSLSQSKSESINENSNIAVWDNETILEVYGDDLALHKYDGSDSVIRQDEPKQIHTPFIVQLEDGKVLVTGKVKRITHKSKGANASNSKSSTLDTSSVKTSYQNDSKTKSDVKTKDVTKESGSIPWGWIAVLGAFLVTVYLLIRKAFF